MNKEKIEKILKVYGQILLWIFIITITATTIYIMSNPEKFCKKTIEYDPRIPIEIQEEPGNQLECEIISLQEMEEKNKRSQRLNIIGVICILGMIVFNPDIKRKAKKFWRKVE